MDRSITNRFAVAVIAVLVALGLAAQSQAQTNLMTYSARFICSCAPGQVTDSGGLGSTGPVTYRMTQPGDYSTVIEILNARYSGQDSAVNVELFVAGLPAAYIPGFTVAAYSSARIDCGKIVERLELVGFEADGRVVEGFASIAARDTYSNSGSELDVSVIYTHASRNSDKYGTGLGASIDVVTIEGKPQVLGE